MTLEEAIAQFGLRKPPGGARPNEWFERPNTYIDKLGAQRAKFPPVNWDDRPYKTAMSPNILNDPAFSQYDLSQLRGFKQDPKLRDERDLGLASLPSQAYGYTYIPDRSPYDPDKVYVRDYGNLGLGNLKMATGPGAEQTKQGNINKELASTIAHEFRHNLFNQPRYSDIIDKVYEKLGGTMGRHKIGEYVNRAADAELIPGNWDWAEFDIPESLHRFQKSFNLKQQAMYNRSPINTTDIFNQAAKEFFKRVEYHKMSKAQKQAQMQQTIQQAEEAAKKVTTEGPPSIISRPTVTTGGPPGGGDPGMTYPAPTKKDSPIQPRPFIFPGMLGAGIAGILSGPLEDRGRGQEDRGQGQEDRGQRGSNRGGFTDPGKGSYGPWKADGGLIDIPLTGRRRDI